MAGRAWQASNTQVRDKHAAGAFLHVLGSLASRQPLRRVLFTFEHIKTAKNSRRRRLAFDLKACQASTYPAALMYSEGDRAHAGKRIWDLQQGQQQQACSGIAADITGAAGARAPPARAWREVIQEHG
jgi:hypothetical protein